MNWLRISNPLLLLTAGALIAALALAVWLSSGSWAGSADAAQDNEIVLATAFSISRNAGSMVASASTATSYTLPPNTLGRLSASFEESKARLDEDLSMLEGRGYDDSVARIGQIIGALTDNIELIEGERSDFLRLQQESQAAHRRLNYEISKPLDAALVTSLDDQLDRMVRGEGDAVDPAEWTSNTLTAADVLVYHHLFNMVEAERMLINKMKGASLTQDAKISAMIQEDYDSAYQRMTTSLEYLSQHGAEALDPKVIPLSVEMLNLGSGEDNIWEKMYDRLARESLENGWIAANQQILDDLLRELDVLVAEASP